MHTVFTASSLSRFNPRPPSPRGDARQAGRCASSSGFQSTPPVTEGRCVLNPADWATMETVSIHAPRHRGAMPAAAVKSRARIRRFNPRPPSPRGDAAASPR
ncbi:hypothetical protein ebA3258 [Aromatoleum aromaticum EbN1]|nr:hypothetical protein ebA3258 [Aromatoleum aromaticum EbN1]